MDPVNFKTFSQQMGKLIKAIEKQNDINAEIAKSLRDIADKKSTPEVTFNTRINDDSVFVTKLHVDEINEKTVVESFAKMLKALGHVLLVVNEPTVEEMKTDKK